MKFLRSLGLGAIMAVLAATSPAAASATELKTFFSLMVTAGSTLSAEAEGSQVFSTPFGTIECTGSSISAKTSNTGGASETVNATVEALTFTGCSATVTVLAKGTLEIHTQEGSANNNGSITSTGAEVTIEKAGVHCIYKTSSTKIGTLTGSATTGKTATYDIAATVPRTGGKAGVFCGSTGEWKGSYKVTTPDVLNVDAAPPPPAATTLTTSLSGEAKSGEEITVNEGAKVKDQATLSGENAATATGTIKYAVYSDNKCEKLVTKAGETAFSEGKVPASEEKTLEAGSVYYWQAEYTGDSKNAASKSSCGKEVLTVKAATSLTTSLSGEAKSGEEITVNEGAKVKDTATLSGTKSSTATGKAKYKIYADKECKELVTEAGEVTVSEGKVPASEEKTLEAGRVYYWQATYEGDTFHQASASTCGKEVLTVKAATTLTTSLSGEAKSGEEITVLEGSKVKDTATLSGTKSSTATGKVKYKVYADKECKELVTEAGEVTVSGGSVPASEEKTLEAGRVYYWQATYEGDTLHQASTSTCGKEVLTVKAAISLSTLLGGEDPIAEKPIEGEEISVPKGTAVADSATLSGTKSSTATGKVSFKVYADKECKELFAEAGEASVEKASAAPSEEVELKGEGSYYWQATYEGDTLHQAATSPCTEVVHVLSGTSLATTLSGEGEEGEVLEVSEEAHVSDAATLSGAKAAEATGTVEYKVYSDIECKELVTEAGEVTVAGESVPASNEVMLEPGVYYWQAVYSGDAVNLASTSPCGSEVALVVPPVTTTLTGGGESGAVIRVLEGTPVHDQATLQGENAAEATGTLEYLVYADEECEELVAKAGEVVVEGATVPASSSVELEAPGTYYWQAVYSGDELNPAATSPCTSELAIVTVPTSLTTSLSGGGEEGTEISVEEGTLVSDQATLSGSKAATASGTVRYTVYADSSCTEPAAPASVGDVEEGVVEPLSEVTLPPGTYYWQAEYWGDDVNAESVDECGGQVEHVTAPITTSLSGESQSGTEIQVAKGASVTDQATLHGEHASEATGTVEYLVYSDESCEKLLTKAGPFEFKEGKVPSSGSVEIKEPGVYFWRVNYSGDGKNPAATSPCGSEIAQGVDPDKWVYAAFGNSYSSGEGIWATKGKGSYYEHTAEPKSGGNRCHRSPYAWPALIAEKAFGNAVLDPPTIYERTSRFIFRACSGAKTANIWSGAGSEQNGQYDEYVEPKDLVKTPTQLTWLPAKGDNPDIAKVSVGVGGNDAGFGSIIKACLAVSRRYVRLWKYDPGPCQTEIKSWEDSGFPEIKDNLQKILQEIAKRAPNAKTVVFLYPHVFNLAEPEISVNAGFVINNKKDPKNPNQITAAESIENFITNLNGVIAGTVAAAGIRKAKAVDATQAALTAFGDHRLGDKDPWLNGLRYPFVESFHPSLCAHKAVAELARRYIDLNAAAIGTCK
jgi:hypothetical protein